MYLVFKEAVNNMLKYSRATELNVTVKIVGQNLYLHLIDNGQGFDLNKSQSGNGLRNMTKRINDLEAQIEIITSPGQGCAIKCTLDIAKIRET
jgi:signal transduction histidine kinase